MEILSKIKLLAFLVIASLSVNAQDKAQIDAFSNSYSYELKGDYNKAITSLKAVYNEKSYETNLRLGWVTYLAGSFTESAAYYQKAINLNPYSIEPKLGYIYPATALGNWDQVKKQYEDIVKIDDKNTSANYKLGMILYGKADYKNAYKYFEKLANLYPFDYDSVIMFAWANYRIQKYREAKVLFSKCLLMKPNDSSALEGLSLIK